MTIAAALKKMNKRIDDVFLIIAVVLLLAMMFLGSADVASRYLFNRPITGTAEWSQVLMAGIVFLCWGYVQSSNSHIRMDFLVMKYPRLGKQIVEGVILVLLIVLFGLMLWQSAVIAWQDFKQDRVIETILIPSYLFKMLVPFGALLVCLECISQLVNLFTPTESKGR